MLSFPTDVNCIEALYQSGDITPRGLAAMVFDRPSDIAPIAWLAEHHPEVLDTPEKAMSAYKAIALTCNTCHKFSSQHGMCTDLNQVQGGSCREVTPTTNACDRYEASLPNFPKNHGSN